MTQNDLFIQRDRMDLERLWSDSEEIELSQFLSEDQA